MFALCGLPQLRFWLRFRICLFGILFILFLILFRYRWLLSLRFPLRFRSRLKEDWISLLLLNGQQIVFPAFLRSIICL